MIPFSLFSGADQIGLVVHKLEPWLERYVAMGIGPWWVGTYAAPVLSEMRVRGRETEYSMRLGLAWMGKMQLELIEPLDGPSIYKEHLAQHGEGFHHVQVSYGSLAYAAFESEMAARNSPPIMEGRYAGSKFAYFDTTATLGMLVEVRDAPKDYVRPEPDYWYPADAAPIAFAR
ncbi:MAG: lactoylglutathione lyase-like protein [Microvirga sp.]|jgi:hypothetical protein|nr:lactoylglutathione lyase-like protein [Microvirga sp.]